MKKMSDYKNYILRTKSNEELLDDFISELILFRKENNLTQELLSAYSNVSRTKIARIESKNNSPTIKTIIEILGPLGYTIKIEKSENLK